MIDATSKVRAEPSTGLLGPVFGDLTLRICGTRYDGQVVRIGAEKCSIGSGLGCTLRLRAAGIDPLHCLILRGQSKTVVKQWSPNTRLNGRSFTDARLNVGDRLAIGPIEFEVLADTPHDLFKPDSDEVAKDQTDPTALELKLSESRQLGKSRIRNLTGELRTARQRQHELEIVAHERTRQVAEMDARLEELKTLVSQLQDERNALDHQRLSAEDRLSELGAESKQRRDQLEEFKQVSATQREEWEQERGRLMEEINRCQKELEDHVQSASELPAPTNQTMVLTGARQEDGEVKWADDFSQPTDTYEQERQEWKDERASLLEEIEEYKRQLDAHSQPDDKPESTPRTTLVLNGAHQEDGQVKWSDELLEAKETYDRDRQQWARENEQLQQELTKYCQQTKKQEEELGAAAKQTEALRLQWEQEVNDLRESLATIEQPISSDEKLAKKLADTETKLTASKEEIKQLRIQLSELDHEQEVYHTRNMGRESEVRKAEAVLDERARQLDAARSELNHRREVLDAERAQFEQERRVPNETEESPHDTDSTDDERAGQLEEAHTKLMGEREAFEQERADWEEHRKHLEAQMSDATADLSRQEAELASQWAELSGFQAGIPESPGHTVRWSAHADQTIDDFSADESNSSLGDHESEPYQQEEITFEQTSDAPPLSTADVFAKMGNAGMLSDEDCEDVATDETAGSKKHAAIANDSSLRSTQPLSAIDAKSNESGEDSIEDYMARLLKRVRGEEVGTAATRQASLVEASQPSTFGNDVESSTPVERDENLDPTKYIPRRQAPEASNNLAAMRELANQSARAAIQTSEKHRKNTASRSKLAIAGAAAVIGLGLLLLSNGILSLTVFGAIIFFGVAGYLGHQALAMRKTRPSAGIAHEVSPRESHRGVPNETTTAKADQSQPSNRHDSHDDAKD